ncbi:response regulator transcription factor [Ruminococcus sp.]|uniref:winged helix-turn-helix domain-containing protein n=1 Tax=Ruminococcus sp. TaxID=41978 RepID=UPI0025DCBC7A|nr:response regulator transcription factor [Ruminococcus sp.]
MIYLVEDDDSIRELVIYTLRSTGMEAQGFALPSAFWNAMAAQKPELVLLDIMLPEEDGLEILKKIRREKATRELPVIMLTAKGTEYDQVVGLDCGADDYVPKPFGMMALVARIKAVMRRTEKPTEEKILYLGELTVNSTRHVVQVAGETVNLTLKEFELLCLLLENPGVVFTRDQLLNQIWGYSFDGESRTVDVHVRHLRQKLGECGKYIETVRGIGYRSGDGTT